MRNDSDTLVRLLVAGDLDAVRVELDRSAGSAEPVRHLVAALVADDPGSALDAAARLARNTRDRQLLAITTAFLADRPDLVTALVRDHLVDHPDSLLAVWIVSRPTAHQE